MSKFIEVNLAESKRKIYLNILYIEKFEKHLNYTHIFTTGNNASMYEVSETPEEIMEMLAD